MSGLSLGLEMTQCGRLDHDVYRLRRQTRRPSHPSPSSSCHFLFHLYYTRQPIMTVSTSGHIFRLSLHSQHTKTDQSSPCSSTIPVRRPTSKSRERILTSFQSASLSSCQRSPSLGPSSVLCHSLSGKSKSGTRYLSFLLTHPGCSTSSVRTLW
jgi:hypothetical protein